MKRQDNSVGLVGDGDEIAAIHNVEAAFAVKLYYADAPNWRTAGHVYEALRRALPEVDADPGTWARFCNALAHETGVDPTGIDYDSTLLVTPSKVSAVLSLVRWLGPIFLAVGLAFWLLERTV